MKKNAEEVKKNVLYLLEMGLNDPEISTDIKNHRIRTVENIDIFYNSENFNMFFEFTRGAHRRYRRYNKRTGKLLKKPVEEIVLKDGIYIDTEFQRTETDRTGRTFETSWRHSELEQEFFKEHHAYTKKDILEIVNRYKIGVKYTEVCLIEQKATDIIRKNGGFRELDILNGDSYFKIGETWNNEHKTVHCIKREWEAIANGQKLVDGKSCEVDLVTGKITG